MPDPITKRLAALPNLNKVALSELWKEFFHASPPAHLRRDLMIPILGYRIQEQTFGSIGNATRARLCQLASAFETDSKSVLSSIPGIKSGTRLVRQWGEQVHLVNVEAEGYEYRGIRYQSLSEIARLITGTRWSGPLFFGIKNRQSRSKEAA